MRVIALAVLLAIFQTGSPASPRPDTNRDIDKNAERKQYPSAQSLAVLNTHTATIPSSGSGSKPEDDKQHQSLDITKLPPVTVRTGFGDILYLVFSGMLVAVGGLQVWLLRRTLGAIKRQGDLMEKTLVATFRPKLRVRKVSIDRYEPRKVVRYTVVNIGETPAYIVKGKVAMKNMEGHLPPLPTWGANATSIERLTLEAGERIQQEWQFDDGTAEKFGFLDLARAGGSEALGFLHFLGYVHYRDDAGIIRHTGFCRHYNAFTERFESVLDAEYEYAD